MNELKYQIYIGDCLSVLDQIEDGTIKCVVTSPPYNVGKNYNDYNDNNKNYIQFITKVFQKIYLKLTFDGIVFLNIGSLQDNHKDVIKIISNLCDTYQYIDKIIWYKSNYSWITNQSLECLDNCYEDVYVFGRSEKNILKLENLRGYNKFYNGKYYKDNDLNKPTNLWNIPSDIANNTGHPAVFPKTLPEMCILLGSKEGDLVFDPFLGSGTTMKSCFELKRSCIGSEIDETYLDVIKEKVGFGQQTLDNQNVFDIINSQKLECKNCGLKIQDSLDENGICEVCRG